MIHQFHKDFKKGHQELGQDSPRSSSPFMESWKEKEVPDKAAVGVRGSGVKKISSKSDNWFHV